SALVLARDSDRRRADREERGSLALVAGLHLLEEILVDDLRQFEAGIAVVVQALRGHDTADDAEPGDLLRHRVPEPGTHRAGVRADGEDHAGLLSEHLRRALR